MLAAAAAMEQQINAQAPALDAKSIAAMKAAGLQVVTLDAEGRRRASAAPPRQLAARSAAA